MAPLLHNKWKWRLYTIVFVCKDNANEGNGSLLTISRAHLILCKDNVNSCSDKINYGCFMHE